MLLDVKLVVVTNTLSRQIRSHVAVDVQCLRCAWGAQLGGCVVGASTQNAVFPRSLVNFIVRVVHTTSSSSSLQIPHLRYACRVCTCFHALHAHYLTTTAAKQLSSDMLTRTVDVMAPSKPVFGRVRKGTRLLRKGIVGKGAETLVKNDGKKITPKKTLQREPVLLRLPLVPNLCKNGPLLPEHTLSLAYRPKGQLVGRAEEEQKLKQLLSKMLRPDAPSGSVYVSGLPGTGKSLVVSRVVNDCTTSSGTESAEQVRTVWVNCAKFSKPSLLFPHLASELRISVPSGSSPLEAIREYASSSGPKTVIVLDEVDFLICREQTVLYPVFEWSCGMSRLVTVGIANSLDLPTRLLPWLRGRNCMPEMLPFAPYTAPALQAIVQQRLAGASTDNTMLSGGAILLASKKVAAASGDARLVLDVCREALTTLRESGGDAVSIVSSMLQRRGNSHVVQVIRDLPVQQQLALCVAANACTSLDNASAQSRPSLLKKTTMGGLHECFTRMCARARVRALSFADFVDICSNALASHALLDVTPLRRRKGTQDTQRNRQVRLRVPVDDVRAGVADKGFLPFLVADSDR